MVQVVELRVTGMTCDHCVRAVTGAIGDAEGVNPDSVQVMLDAGEARFEGDGFNIQQILEAIEEEGYEAELAPTGAG